MKIKLLLLLALALFIFGFVNIPYTDHWDGPAVSKEPSADITDFFAIPVAKDKLVLIMSIHPGATAETEFSNAIQYSIRMRKIKDFKSNPISPVIDTDEVRLSFMMDPSDSKKMNGKIEIIDESGQSKTFDKTQVKINSTKGGKNDNFKLFAGNRADQSFTDLGRVRMPVWRDKGFDDRPGINGLDGKNVLTLVAEIKYDFIGEHLWAIVSQTERLSKDYMPLDQIDRMGRLEMTVFVIQNDSIKDLWNQEDTFNVSPKHRKIYRDSLQKGLHRLDNFEKALDGSNVIDWKTPHPLIELFLNDFLIVNTKYTTTPENTTIHYMDNEWNLVLGKSLTGPGGRSPNEDVIKRTLTLLINGPNRPEPNRGVGVPSPSRPADNKFPYVQKPFRD